MKVQYLKVPLKFLEPLGNLQFDKIFKYDLWCKSLIAQQAFLQ